MAVISIPPSQAAERTRTTTEEREVSASFLGMRGDAVRISGFVSASFNRQSADPRLLVTVVETTISQEGESDRFYAFSSDLEPGAFTLTRMDAASLTVEFEICQEFDENVCVPMSIALDWTGVGRTTRTRTTEHTSQPNGWTHRETSFRSAALEGDVEFGDDSLDVDNRIFHPPQRDLVPVLISNRRGPVDH